MSPGLVTVAVTSISSPSCTWPVHSFTTAMSGFRMSVVQPSSASTGTLSPFKPVAVTTLEDSVPAGVVVDGHGVHQRVVIQGLNDAGSRDGAGVADGEGPPAVGGGHERVRPVE